ncbi:MAG: spore cortex biosynthesis protein YabQ [Clostridia bacterium]|nr:spore cortex biosynthesis protein YabQ [Clostridia bacterium]
MAVSFICGFVLSFVYDIFRILRIVRGNVYDFAGIKSRFYSHFSMFAFYEKHKKQKKNKKLEWVIYFFEDLIYSLLVCVVVVISAYCFNYGKVRFFSIMSLAFGFVLWRVIFGALFVTVFEHFIYFLKVILFYIFYPITFLCGKIKKVIYKSIRLLYNKKREKMSAAKAARNRSKITKIATVSIHMEKK